MAFTRCLIIISILALAALGTLGVMQPALDPPSPFVKFPKITLWAWERSEDLSQLDVRRFGIAYLDQTITLHESASSRPRLQRLQLPSGAHVTAVVRIEAPYQRSRVDRSELADEVTELILRSANKSGIHALQIDFDATESQRPFYRKLLTLVRKRMPPKMPLSMTALASWCSGGDWIGTLPVQEAVPMFFRMGPAAQSRTQAGWKYPVHEPLCQTSAGVSTDEPWPALDPKHRLYVFHPRAWSETAIHNLNSELEK